MSTTHGLADEPSKVAGQIVPLFIADAAQTTMPTLGEGTLPHRVRGVVKKPVPEDIRYYNLKRNWTKKIEPHLRDLELNDILTRDMNKFTIGNYGSPFGEDELPHDRETAFVYFEQRGPFARYRYYTRSRACHWLVNFSLRLATLAVPSKEWRIIISDSHSTVWNGKDVLFDFNYYYLGITAAECFELAYDVEGAPGLYLNVGFPTDTSR